MAIAIAMVTGLMLIAMGVLRLGFLAKFLSHPVISGFITAAAVQIAAGQVGPLLGIRVKGESLLEVMTSLAPNLIKANPYTAAIGLASLVFLFWARSGLKPLMLRFGLGERPADILAKVGPAMAIVAATAFVWGLGMDTRGVGILGAVPQGLPTPAWPAFDASLWTKILVPSLLICIVGYVESISVAMTLAAKRRQRVDPDQELIALGVADIGSAVSGGFPVTGALSRSVVNFEAGAQTPAAGAFTAVGVAVATLFLTPLLFFLPKAALGAIIIVAVLSLVDINALKRHLDLFQGRFRGHGRHDPLDVGRRCRGGPAGGRSTLDFSAPLPHVETARSGRRPDPGDAVVSQRGTPHRGDRSRDPVAPGGRESLFSERPFSRGSINESVAANPAIRHSSSNAPR